jgi:hypothetical protein
MADVPDLSQRALEWASAAGLGGVLLKLIEKALSQKKEQAEADLTAAQTAKTKADTKTPEQMAVELLLGTVDRLQKQLELQSDDSARRDEAAAKREEELLSRIDGLEKKTEKLQNDLDEERAARRAGCAACDRIAPTPIQG